MPKRTSYQDGVIRNYYRNRDEIMLQRLGDLITELYLAEGQARTRLWKRAAQALAKLKVPAEQIERLVRADDPAAAAGVLKRLLERAG
jgi:ATP/maltotriose-dependent transcriptional regulator MalT